MESKINELYLYWFCNQLNLYERAVNINRYLEAIQDLLPVKQFIIADGENNNTISTSFSSHNVEQILSLIKKDVSRHYKKKDVPNEFSEDISSRVTLIAEGLVVKFAIGGCVKGAPNSLRFEGNLLQFINIIQLFKESINYFKPNWGVVTQYDFVEEVLKQTNDDYWFGWMTYFSDEIKLPRIPSEIKIEKLPHGGKILLTTEDVFDTYNNEHANRAKALAQAFKIANIKR